MVVEEMSREECLQTLAEAPVARLACAADNQPYVVPVFLAYYQSEEGDDYLYGFTTIGQKVQWLRANPLVCVEVDDIRSRSEWKSVVAYGRYEELPNIHEQAAGRTPARSSCGESDCVRPRRANAFNEQLFAHQLLEARAMWWEPAYSVRTNVVRRDEPKSTAPVFYKIRLTQVTGDRARRDEDPEPEVAEPATIPPMARVGWLRKALSRWRGEFKACDATVRQTDAHPLDRHSAR